MHGNNTAVPSGAPAPILPEVRRAITTLFNPCDIVEVRVPKSNPGDKTLAGWFDDHDKLAEAVAALSGTKPAVYYTLNPVRPTLAVPAQNANQIAPVAETTKDSDIDRRRWLLIDFDPKRPTKVSSTDAEKELGFQTAIDVRQFLTDRGFPAPVSADSGNGVHLLYRLDLPNTSELTNIVRQFLKALAEKFDTDAVEIDQSVYNAARITKAYGSFVSKGTNTNDRPHRLSRLRIVPDVPTAVTLDQLKAVAGLGAIHASKQNSGLVVKAQKPKSVTSIEITSEKVEDFFAFYEIKHNGPKDTPEGPMWTVDCPWGSTDHSDGRTEAFVFLCANKLGFKCHHTHCVNRHWKEYRDFHEQKGGGKFWFKDNLVEVTATSAPASGTFIKRRASDIQPTAINWLWEGRIVGGKLNLFCGHPGMGKGLATMDIAARVSTATDFPDAANPNPAKKVLIFSSEDAAEDTIVPRLKASEANLENVVIIEMVANEDGTERAFSLDRDLPKLQKELESDDYGVVIIDPVMNHIGDVDAYKDQEIRKVLSPLQKLAERQNVAFILVAHLNKKSDADLISRVGGGMGIVGVCRSAWMFTESKDDEGTRLMSSLKSNLTASNESMSFEIGGVPVKVFNSKKGVWEMQDIGHVVWKGKSKEVLTAEHVGFKSKEPSKQSKCESWLLHYLTKLMAGKPVPAKEIYDLAAALGFSDKMTKRAYDKLDGIKPVQTKDGWFWQIVPPAEVEPKEAA